MQLYDITVSYGKHMCLILFEIPRLALANNTNDANNGNKQRSITALQAPRDKLELYRLRG